MVAKQPAKLVLLSALPLAIAAGAAGCLNASLASARKSLAASDYAQAHEQLVTALANPKKLSARERREVKDDLCLTEAALGPPQYSLGETHERCAEAASEPGSQAEPILRRIEEEILARDAQEVTKALAHGQLAAAERAALHYQSSPGADPRLVAEWRRKIWAIAENSNGPLMPVASRKASSAVAELTKQYPEVRGTGRTAFAKWIAKQSAVSGKPLFSTVTVRKDSNVDLWVSQDNLQALAFNLGKLVEINDAAIARCGCSGHTNVGIADTGFPAYLVRLDPETGHSQVLILPRR